MSPVTGAMQCCARSWNNILKEWMPLCFAKKIAGCEGQEVAEGWRPLFIVIAICSQILMTVIKQLSSVIQECCFKAFPLHRERERESARACLMFCNYGHGLMIPLSCFWGVIQEWVISEKLACWLEVHCYIVYCLTLPSGILWTCD
jgi:hypothetical protein